MAEGEIVNGPTTTDQCLYPKFAEQLCPEDYETLPDTMKAYVGRSQNNFLNATPSVLKFPHDDPWKHFAKLVIWNKSKHAVDFRIQQPTTNFFSIYYEKTHLFPGTEATVMVRCMPKGQRICSDCIRIYVDRQDTDVLLIPLEILPSSKWFTLPKIVVMPVIPIGRCYDVNIPLPEPPMTEEALYFHVKIKSEYLETITVTPTEGYIGSQPSATVVYTGYLTLTYHPREYCTFGYTFSLNFPQMETMEPYEITVHCRCIPGHESEMILGSLNQLRIPNELNEPLKKPKHPRLKLKPIEKRELEEEPGPIVPDLSTTAAVMKFLLMPSEKLRPVTEITAQHPLGVNDPEHRRQYKKMELEFHDKLNRIEIHQESMHLKHSKAFHGQDPYQEVHGKSVRAERQIYIQEYQHILGLHDDNMEDMSRTKLQRSNQRCIRDVDENYIPDQKSSVTKFQFMSSHTSNPQHWARLEILRRFVQAARLVITRKRADKRIVKLRLLIKETKRAREAEASEKARLAKIALKEYQAQALLRLSQSSEGSKPTSSSVPSGSTPETAKEPIPIGDTPAIVTGKEHRKHRHRQSSAPAPKQ